MKSTKLLPPSSSTGSLTTKAINTTPSLQANFKTQAFLREQEKRKTLQNKREYKILFPTMRGENLSSTHSPSKDESSFSIEYLNDVTTAPSAPNLPSSR